MRPILGKLILMIGFVLGAVFLGKADCPQVQKPAACVVNVVNEANTLADVLTILPAELNYIWFIHECASVPKVRFVAAETLQGYIPADYKPPEINSIEQAVYSFNLLNLANPGDTQILNCQNKTTTLALHTTYRNPRDAI